MSYICNKCKNAVVGERQNKVVTKVRPVTYHRYITKMNRETREDEKIYITEYYGTEIVSEDNVCDTCAPACADTPEMVGETKHVEFTYRTSKFKRELMRNEERDSRRGSRKDRDHEDFKEKYGDEDNE